MSKIVIVTDSDASLPPPLAAEYNIRQVPITVHLNDEVFETGVDIDDIKLFEWIDREGKIPTTAAPSPGKFAEAFRAAFDQDGADAVVCLTVSGEISGTYDAARMAATQLVDDKSITVVDTKCLSLAQGFMAIAAAEAAQNGASVDEVVAAAMDLQDRVHLYGALSTLKYIAMGGRVSTLKAEMANLLSIKPILSLDNGKLDLLEQVRTRKKAWARMMELLELAAGGKEIERLGIVHVTALEQAKEFEGLLRQRMSCPEDVLIAEFTAGLSVHGGAGLIGVCAVTAR